MKVRVLDRISTDPDNTTPFHYTWWECADNPKPTPLNYTNGARSGQEGDTPCPLSDIPGTICFTLPELEDDVAAWLVANPPEEPPPEEG